MPRSARDDGPRPPRGRGPRSLRLTRRHLISGAALAGAGAGAGLDRLLGGPGTDRAAPAVAFYGRHQAGIATPMPSSLLFASFDFLGSGARDLRDLLERWTQAAAALTSGRPSAADTGETVGLGPSGLTLTVGLGPGLFSPGRLGLPAGRRPAGLVPLPPFAGENLDPAASGGDLCVQACAEDAQVAFHAIHALTRVGGRAVSLRWAQAGFRPASDVLRGQTPRNLLGFRDGTNNIRGDDAGALDRFVWVPSSDGPSWMAGGTFLIVRRIEISLSSWDGTRVSAQEQAIGRHKLSGAPLGAAHEHDAVDLGARRPDGQPVIPGDAHVRVANPQTNDGQRILRRGYSFTRGSTPGSVSRGGHDVDAGLFFIAFVRDPARQFIPLQRRLATGDALSAFTVHTASAIFACPPGAAAGGFLGERLFL